MPHVIDEQDSLCQDKRPYNVLAPKAMEEEDSRHQRMLHASAFSMIF